MGSFSHHRSRPDGRTQLELNPVAVTRNDHSVKPWLLAIPSPDLVSHSRIDRSRSPRYTHHHGAARPHLVRVVEEVEVHIHHASLSARFFEGFGPNSANPIFAAASFCIVGVTWL